MKKALALVIAIVMALGCMSITAFAEMIKINEVKVTVSNYNPTDYSIDVSVPDEAAYSINSVSIVFCEGNKVQLIYNVYGQHWTGLNDFYGYDNDVAPDFSGHSFNTFALIHVSLPNVFPPVPGQDEYMFDTDNTLAYVNDTAMTKVDSEVFEDGKYTVNFRDVRIYIDPDQYTAPAGKSGSADITLTVAKEFTYDMVIPEAVSIDAAGVHSVGQAKVANVKNATDDTVISYTAATTDFKCEDKDDIPASYYTDEAGQNAFPTTAVEVYKNKADAASIPTMYVGISETDWNAAENGTYTATVTYNFESAPSVQ